MRAFAVALIVGLAALAATLPALAVDRALGAAVPKPPLGGAPWSDADRAALQRDLDELVANAPGFAGAHVGLIVAPADGGAPLYARAAADAFVPASVMKLVTGSAALDLLGPAYRLRTTADVRDGKQLVVRGGGDVLLDGGGLDDLVRTLQAAGLTTFPNGVAVDGSRYDDEPYPPGWMVDDLPFDYAAPVGAVGFERNALHVTVLPGAAPRQPGIVRVSGAARDAGFCLDGCFPTLDAVVANAFVTTGEPSQPDTVDVRRTRESTYEVFGTIPAGHDPDTFDLAVPNGGVYLRSSLVQRMTTAGMTAGRWTPLSHTLPTYDVGRYARPGIPVWTHDSEPLTDLLADCWLPSDNLLAEILLREIAVGASGVPASRVKGVAYLATWLRGLGVAVDRVELTDGSGLSAYDRLTPRAALAVLRHDWSGPYRDVVLDALPIAGVRGTLAHRYATPDLTGRIFAKTGTVSHASAIAGFLATRRHGTAAFAFFVDDRVAGDSAPLDAIRARIFARIAGA